jgi:bacterioferritin-associated ferredoxin
MSIKIVRPGVPRRASEEEATLFVCICRAVTVRVVTETIDAGATSLDAVEAACGAGGDCGTCRREIACILREREPLAGSGSRAA